MIFMTRLSIKSAGDLLESQFYFFWNVRYVYRRDLRNYVCLKLSAIFANLSKVITCKTLVRIAMFSFTLEHEGENRISSSIIVKLFSGQLLHTRQSVFAGQTILKISFIIIDWNCLSPNMVYIKLLNNNGYISSTYIVVCQAHVTEF